MRSLPLVLVLVLFVLGAARDGVDRWIDATELPSLVPSPSVEVLDRTGQLLRAYTVADGRWRLATVLARVDPDYLRLLIAYEDKRFYRHGGVDLWAVLRATGQAVRHGRVVSGASTITMQLARLLEETGTGSWRGKLRQIRVALALERRLTKDEILTQYLNRAPYGGNLEGLRSASRAYLGKDPVRLSAAEAALLVALPQAPEARRPDRAPEAARAARHLALVRAGAAGIWDQALLDHADTVPIPRQRAPFPANAAHLADRIATTRPEAHTHRLTIDKQLQVSLEQLAAAALKGRDPALTAAILVANHRTGEIRASVANAAPREERRQGWVDMTRAVRSPGSTLKPLIYALAFDQGLAHPETLIEDRPTDFGGYTPVNFDGAFRGTLRVREALTLSLNIPAVRVAEALGPAAIMAALARAGAEPALPSGAPGLAIALGGVGLTLEDLVVLYGAMANGGAARTLSATEIGTDGARVVSPEAAWQIGHILSGIASPAGAPDVGIAYKTGTSYGHRDAWAIGYDGAHVVGVWMGRADGTPVPGAFGAESAAPLLFDVFARLGSVEPLGPPPPATLLVATSELPAPLQRFGGLVDKPGPELAFPPDGAEIVADGPLVARIRDGTPPFTWLAEGAPIAQGVRTRSIALPLAPGYTELAVVDANGHAARATIRLIE